MKCLAFHRPYLSGFVYVVPLSSSLPMTKCPESPSSLSPLPVPLPPQFHFYHRNVSLEAMASGAGAGAGGRAELLKEGRKEGRKAGVVEINENSVNEEEPSFRKRPQQRSEGKEGRTEGGASSSRRRGRQRVELESGR